MDLNSISSIMQISDEKVKKIVDDYINQYRQYMTLPKNILITDQMPELKATFLYIGKENILGYFEGIKMFEIFDGQKLESIVLGLNWLFEKSNTESPFFYSTHSVRKRLISVLEPLVVLMEVEDTKGYSHSQRVSRLFVSYAKSIGLQGIEENLLLHYAMLHDVGRIGLEQLMLYSPTRLRIFEDTGQDHTIAGSVYISTLEVLNDFLPFVRNHHERYDGKGFPDQLKGDQIPYWVRALSIVNWYDNALNTVDSEFSTGVMTTTEALKIIREDRGRLFDPALAVEFVKFFLLKQHEV